MQIPTSRLLADYILHTKDKTAENIARGKERMDYYYTFLLSETKNHVVERTKYSKLKANQRSFILPGDYIKMKRVRVRIAGVWYLLLPVHSLDKWADVTALETTTSIPIQYAIVNEQGQLHIELTDIPNADSNVRNFEIVYEGYQDPLLFPDDYTTGLITINQESADVAGNTLTQWTDDMIGRFLKVNNGKTWYEIANVGSIHVLSLVNYFQETSVENVSYTIAEVPRLPHEYHRTPLWGAVAEYYLPNNAKKSADYERLYARDVLLIQNKYQSKTTGRVSPGVRVGNPLNKVPRNYPTSALTRR